MGPERPAVISRYVENSKEIEIDAVANKGEILVYAISVITSYSIHYTKLYELPRPIRPR